MRFRTFCINNRHIYYREILSSDPIFEKFYLIENPEQMEVIAIPDGSIDFEFTWEKNTCRGYVCGSFLQGQKSAVSRYRQCFGLRLRWNMRFCFLGKSMVGLVDRRIPLSDYLDVSFLEKRLCGCSELEEMLEETLEFFKDQRYYTLPVIACNAVQMITQSTGAQRVSDIADLMGYTQHYVNSIFKQNYGVPLKKYSDIVRMQMALRYLESVNILDVTVGLGYYDQAHFNRNFKQFTCVTPKAFIDVVCNRKKYVVV